MYIHKQKVGGIMFIRVYFMRRCYVFSYCITHKLHVIEA